MANFGNILRPNANNKQKKEANAKQLRYVICLWIGSCLCAWISSFYGLMLFKSACVIVDTIQNTKYNHLQRLFSVFFFIVDCLFYIPFFSFTVLYNRHISLRGDSLVYYACHRRWQWIIPQTRLCLFFRLGGCFSSMLFWQAFSYDVFSLNTAWVWPMANERTL